MEYLDLYKVTGEKTGKTIKRGEQVPEENFLLTVHLCIFNSEGEMLIQQRHRAKGEWANYWDISVGGYVQTGESSKAALTREVYEELGLRLQPTFMFALQVRFGQILDDFYFLNQDISRNEFVLQDEEVANIRWATLSEVLKLRDIGLFVNYESSLLLFLVGTAQLK